MEFRKKNGNKLNNEQKEQQIEPNNPNFLPKKVKTNQKQQRHYKIAGSRWIEVTQDRSSWLSMGRPTYHFQQWTSILPDDQGQILYYLSFIKMVSNYLFFVL